MKISVSVVPTNKDPRTLAHVILKLDEVLTLEGILLKRGELGEFLEYPRYLMTRYITPINGEFADKVFDEVYEKYKELKK